MKLALVKQDVYDDLYVAPNGAPPEELLFSSMGRVGPFGLFSLLRADFHIVEEDSAPECQMWHRVIRKYGTQFRRLKTETVDKIPGQGHKRPGSPHPNGTYAVPADSVDWSRYDVVIAINYAIPTRIIRQHRRTLFAAMIGEANILQDTVHFGYDVSLNQLNRGLAEHDALIVDFPYTFLGPDCLETVLHSHLGRASASRGIYAEVNTTTERPVTAVPHFAPISEATGHPVRVHRQLISDNLAELYDSKYYLKVGGRRTRGNGAIEAISAGALVLMDPHDLVLTQILPKDTWVRSSEEAIERIRYFDANPEQYRRLLALQRSLVRQFVVDYPLESLEHALAHKRAGTLPQGRRDSFYAGLKAKARTLLKRGR